MLSRSAPIEFSLVCRLETSIADGASLTSLTVKEKSSEVVNPLESVEVMVIA